jgi:hypothetical protein
MPIKQGYRTSWGLKLNYGERSPAPGIGIVLYDIPVGDPQEKKNFIQEEWKKMERFREQHQAFILYMASGDRTLAIMI